MELESEGRPSGKAHVDDGGDDLEAENGPLPPCVTPVPVTPVRYTQTSRLSLCHTYTGVRYTQTGRLSLCHTYTGYTCTLHTDR